MCLINTVKNTVQEHNLIQYGDRIVIGVSGGADSVCLLKALHALEHEYNLTLVVCHVNHKIRTETAERDQEFVLNLCNDMNIECHVKEAYVEDLAKEWHMSTEEAGRKVRYDFFAEIALGDKIATAHNKNDTVETVMMRFMRGTGLQGLTGIPYQRDNIIRPLLDVTRKEIETYLADMHQEYMTDETNLEAIYTRNKIRLNLIPEIIQEFNPNFIQTLGNNIQNYQEDNDCLAELAQSFYEEHCYTLKNQQGMEVYMKRLSAQPKAIAKRVLMRMVKEVSGKDATSILLENIMNSLHKEVGTIIQIDDKHVARIGYTHLFIEKAMQKMKNTDVVSLNEIRDEVVQVGNYFIKTSFMKTDEPIVNNAFTFHLPVTKMNNLCFRTRRDGDILMIDKNISKKVNRVFTDKKVPENQRDDFWMLCDGNSVYWIPELFGARFETRTGEFVKFEIL